MNYNSVQHENQYSFELLDFCCKKIEEEFGDKKISEWTNGDFIRLSALLRRKTKIDLSENTLKRIFGKLKTSVRYYPQKATRDALAQYIGYRDWYELELFYQKDKKQALTNVAPITKDEPKQTKWFYTGLSLIFMLIAFAIIYQHNKKVDVSNVKLKCINPEGPTPHSALFKLGYIGKLPDKASRFSIDFADGSSKILSFKDSIISHYYEIPGRYFPKLIYDKTNIDTGYVYLKTKGWVAIATSELDTTRVYPINKQIKTDDKIEVSIKDVLNAGLDTNKTFYVNFCNIKPSTVSGDNFELKANITTSQLRPGVRCSQAGISIYGERDSHLFDLIKPECVAWISYKFSEENRSGENSDLRALGHDLRNGGEIILRIKNKNVSLRVNNRLVLTTQYKKDIGKIMGFKVYFSGIGSIKNLSITDLKTKVNY